MFTESVLAYCVVDVDKPARKYSTSSVVDSKDPLWNEQFILLVQYCNLILLACLLSEKNSEAIVIVYV